MTLQRFSQMGILTLLVAAGLMASVIHPMRGFTHRSHEHRRPEHVRIALIEQTEYLSAVPLLLPRHTV
jgi:hypothetical protein